MLHDYGIRPTSRVAVLIENGTVMAGAYHPDTPQHLDFDALRRYFHGQCDVRRLVYYLPLDRAPKTRDTPDEVTLRARQRWLQYNGYSVQTREYDSRHDKTANFDAAIATDMMVGALTQRLDYLLLIAQSSGLAFPARRCVEAGVPVLGALPLQDRDSNSNPYLRAALSGTLLLSELLASAGCLSVREIRS